MFDLIMPCFEIITPSILLGCNIPQYCLQFLLMIPTTFPVGVFCILFEEINLSSIFSFSKASSTSTSSSSCRIMSLGDDHWSSVKSSIATVSPSTTLLRLLRPWIKIYNKIYIIIADIFSPEKQYRKQINTHGCFHSFYIYISL